MNSDEIKAEIAKVEQEIKTVVENANNKFNILNGMKNAYHKVLTSLESKKAAVETDVKEEVKEAATDIAAKV